MRTVLLLLFGLTVTGAADAQRTQPPLNASRSLAISSWQVKGIDQHNRMLLAKAAALGKTEMVVLFATEMGATDRVIRAAAAKGALVLARFDDVGYFRARAPVVRFNELQALPGVLMIRIDGGLSYDSEQGFVSYPEPKKSRADSIRADSIKKDSTAKDSMRILGLPLAPEAARAAQSPYVAANDMRSYDLRAMDARFDGRGITIGVLEFGTLDFSNPSLKTAKSVTGETIPKVRGVITPRSYDPDLGNTSTLIGDEGAYNTGLGAKDERLVRDVRSVTVQGGSFTADDTTYTTSASGTLLFGRYVKGKATYGALWDPVRKRAWIDTNGNKNLRDDQEMADINETFNAGRLIPLDSTAKEPKRTVSFAVHFDSIPGRLRIYEGTQGHQTMVAGVAAGHSMLGGAGDASAPGAQVIIVDAGLTLHGYIESWIRAARDPRVDLVTSSQIGESFPATGESIVALILSRALEVYDKPFFASAHNAGPMSTVTSEPSTTRRILSIGGYVGAGTYKAHYGWDMPARDYLISYSSRGPALNGGAKPDIVAPVLSISANPCSSKEEHTVAYRFPVCYGLGGGTSSASPHAAGAGALVMSAAKQSGLKYNAARIAWALRMGARFLPYYQADAQGNGLVDVVGAYELLKKNVEIPDIEVRAPVKHQMSRFLRDPGYGDGLYERDGWTSGEVGTRNITLTRRTGSASPVTYKLDWRANDGTFSTKETVTLPLNVPVDVSVRIAPKGMGMHSAHLLLVDRNANVAVRSVLTTIVAAERFSAANAYTVKGSGRREWPHPYSLWVDVPEGASSLQIDLAVKAGRVSMSYSDGTAGYYYIGSGSPKHPQGRGNYIYTGQTASQIIPYPQPGTMEIMVEPFDNPTWGGDSAQYHIPAEVEITARVQGAEAKSIPAPIGSNQATFTFTNLMAPLTEGRVMAEVGVRRVLNASTGPNGLPSVYFINVDSGTTTLRVTADPTDPKNEIFLYLYDCADKACALWDSNLRNEQSKSLVVMKPRAGTWKVVIDAPRTSTGVAFKLTDVMTHPKYGSASSTSSAANRASGSSWTHGMTFTLGATPPIGYDAVGVTDVVDDAVERAEQEKPIAKYKPHISPYRPARVGTAVIPLSR
jgi:hypothetical protein